jgi:hypothetical protein
MVDADSDTSCNSENYTTVQTNVDTT